MHRTTIWETELKLKPCLRCGKCCITHPCALAPNDLANIADFLSLSEQSLFNRFLVLDYVVDSSKTRYYPCPARIGDKPGRIVTTNWPLLSSPCVFLTNDGCRIETVKPRGGKKLLCRNMTSSNHDLVRYGKKKAAKDWIRSQSLDQLLSLTIRNESYANKLGADPSQRRAP